MKLVDAEYIADDEAEIARILNEYPLVKQYLALLINGYRELLHASLYTGDSSDIARSGAKQEMTMNRIGIPLLDTPQQWDEARRQV